MSYAILVLALLEISLLAWAVKTWATDRSNIALLLMLFIILPVCLDSITVATGRWIGFGPALENLNRSRYAWFVFSMPLMWAVCAATLANADFRWAKPPWLVPILVIAAVLVGGYEAAQAWERPFHEACVFDIQRYVLQVPPGQECAGSQTGDGTFGLPLVVPLATLAVALTSLILLFKRKWPWLALSCLAIIIVVNIPQSDLSTFFSYPVDGILTATLAITAVHFHRLRQAL